MGRRLGLALLVMATVLAIPLSGAHGAREPESITVEGEVLDLVCYLSQGARGRSNRLCAAEHTTMDQPQALLAADGRLFVLAADHHTSFAYDTCRTLAGRAVSVLGVPSERGGVRVLEVKKVTPISKEKSR